MNLTHRDTEFLNRVLENRFHLEKKIETGGMSFLYLGRDRDSGDKVVAKICPDPSGKNKFVDEIRLLRSLHHPDIQKIIAYGMTGGIPYYISPYYGEENLREYLSDKPVLPEKEILDHFLQITNAVAYLHRKRILHNDLKPQNILITNENHLILSDFGLASKVNRTKYLPKKQKTIWGSPVYLAPELPQGFNPTYASDVYSLGVILFILTVGYPPFYHDDLDSLITMHQQNEPPHPHTLTPSITRELENIILCAIAKIPEDRFATAEKLQRAILTYQKKFKSQIETNSISRHPEVISPNQEKTRSIPCDS